MDKKEQFSHFAAVITVRNMQASLDYYQHLLGFECSFTWQDPPEYAVLHRGSVNVHLTSGHHKNRPENDAPVIYIFVHDIDQVYTELMNRGTKFDVPIGNREYGMRDFDVLDPDGRLGSMASSTLLNARFRREASC